jgi:hypothetical protein
MDKDQFLIDLSRREVSGTDHIEFAAQSPPQQVFTAVWNLESYVGNGGFLYYFDSPDGATANFVPSALRTIGAHTCADLVERALRKMSADPLPDSTAERIQMVEALDDDARCTFDDLDGEYFEHPDDLTELLFAYVKSKPEVFGKAPKE